MKHNELTVSNKKKSELCNIITKQRVNPVFDELISKIPKDKSRKVCKNCHELGHGITSTVCKYNVDKYTKLKQKIKSYILSKNCLTNKTVDDYCNELSVILDITPNLCKSLYNEIPFIELLEREINLAEYMEHIQRLTIQCHDCKKPIICIHENTNRKWRNKDICDTCWSKYSDERNAIWELIKSYKPIRCVICITGQSTCCERFHYDHLNMFDKKDSICSMVNEGLCIEEIYTEIDKCQILCLTCHHMVTDIENKLGFTRIKQHLTRTLNQGVITHSEYIEQSKTYETAYKHKMKEIYEEMNTHYAKL
jgi:hypothetical protein